MLIGNKIKVLCEVKKIIMEEQIILNAYKTFQYRVGSSCPRQSLKGVGIHLVPGEDGICILSKNKNHSKNKNSNN